MRSLFDVVSQARLLAQKDEELSALRAELQAARAENERMRVSMRRCVTCEYRIEVRANRTEHKLLGRQRADGTQADDDEPSD